MKVIGIDIDDTITNTSGSIKDYVIKHSDEFEDSNQLFSDCHHILAGHKISNDTRNFLDNIFPDLIENVALRENALDVMNNLKNEGYKMALITARADDYFPKGAELITIDYLKKHSIPYDVLVTNSVNKKQACINYKVDIMIDDSVSCCEALKEAGLKTLLFTTDINKDINTDIPRVNNWLEIYEILKLED